MKVVLRLAPPAFFLGSSYVALLPSPAFADGQRENDGFHVSQRLRQGLNPKFQRPRLSRSKNAALKSFTIFNRDGGYTLDPDDKLSLPLARVATIEVKGRPSDVADLFEDITGRKGWDATCADSQKTTSSDGTPVCYFRGKSGVFVPARDFSYTMSRLQGGVVGKDFSAIVLFSKDASDKLPRAGFNVVRGKINSLLIAEPVGTTKTLVTYVVEMDVSGMIASYLLGHSLTAFFTGDAPVQFLARLKAAIEEDNVDETISVEEAARLAWQRKLRKRDEAEKGTSIVDDVGLASESREELQGTISLLENRLKELNKLSSDLVSPELDKLKARVRTDLSKARTQLRKAGQWR